MLIKPENMTREEWEEYLHNLARRRGRFKRGAVGIPFAVGLNKAGTAGVRATYLAGARNVRVAFIGDSTTRGQSTGGGTSQAVNSWPMQLATLLNAAGINAGANNVWGDGGSWGLAQTAANMVTGDSRIVFNSGAALGSLKVAGGNTLTVNAAGSIVFTPQANVNALDVIRRDGATGRNITIQIAAEAPVASNSTNVTQFMIASTSTATPGLHACTITWVAGNNDILGISAYNNTRKELSLWNWGICGATSANLIDNTDTVGRLNIFANASLKPDLALIEGGLINDWRTSVAVATSKANLTTLVTTAKTNGTDVILCVPVFDSGSSGLTASQQLYVDAMYQVATEQNVALVDHRKMSPAPSDTVHPTTAGYLTMATGTVQAIRYALAA